MTEPDDDDIHWADPAIRAEYEAALGRFILAFNEVDHRLSQLIRQELRTRNRHGLADSVATGPFAQRLATLDVLSSNAETRALSSLPFDRLRLFNTVRNRLAHGHFDQNPFDGSYQLVLKAKVHDYPSARVAEMAAELVEIADQFRLTEAIYDFDDVSRERGPRP